MIPSEQKYSVAVFSNTTSDFSIWSLGVSFDVVKRHILRKKREWKSVRFVISRH